MSAQEQFYYKSNRLQQMRGFYYTMQLGSMSKAAEKMGVQQAAVSLQIKSLERDLDVELFTRNGPKIIPTDDANALYSIVLPHIEGIDSLPDLFQKSRAESYNKELKIGGNQVSISYMMPRIVSVLKDEYPESDVTIKTLNMTDALEHLKRDEIHVFIGAVQDCPEGYDFIRMRSHRVILIANPKHPLITADAFHISDIAHYQVVRGPPEFITVPLFEDLMRTYDVSPYVMLEQADWEMFKTFVAESNGFTMVSDLCYDPVRDRHIGTRDLSDYIPPMHYGILMKKGKHLPEPLRFLINRANEP